MIMCKEKQCYKCKRVLPNKFFYRSRRNKSGLSTYCIECIKEKNKTQLKNKNKNYKKWYAKRGGKDWVRDYNLQQKYGITLEQYKLLLKQQDNRCAICGKHQIDEKRFFSVDHNHKTGKIRGIICNFCNNRLLRYLMDNRIRAKGLISYLSKAIKDDNMWVD